MKLYGVIPGVEPVNEGPDRTVSLARIRYQKSMTRRHFGNLWSRQERRTPYDSEHDGAKT